MKKVSLLREIFSKGYALSSKRVFGGIGFLVLLILLCYATFVKIELPDAFELSLITCASLLGVESIAGAFYKQTSVGETKDEKQENINDSIKIQGKGFTETID
jgi:hypothetical protein